MQIPFKINRNIRERRMFSAAAGIVAELRNAGFEAYIVGGAVRDLCLGKLPKDYDITTNAVPAEIMKLFPRSIPLGASFGVVTVVADSMNFEVATFREERDYEDGGARRLCVSAKRRRRTSPGATSRSTPCSLILKKKYSSTAPAVMTISGGEFSARSAIPSSVFRKITCGCSAQSALRSACNWNSTRRQCPQSGNSPINCVFSPRNGCGTSSRGSCAVRCRTGHSVWRRNSVF